MLHSVSSSEAAKAATKNLLEATGCAPAVAEKPKLRRPNTRSGQRGEAVQKRDRPVQTMARKHLDVPAIQATTKVNRRRVRRSAESFSDLALPPEPLVEPHPKAVRGVLVAIDAVQPSLRASTPTGEFRLMPLGKAERQAKGVAKVRLFAAIPATGEPPRFEVEPVV